MGTRYLACVRANGKYKVAHGGALDGSMQGHGWSIANFINTDLDLVKFRKAIDECRFLSDEEVEHLYKDLDNDLITEDDFFNKHPSLDSHAGAVKIFLLIQNEGLRDMFNNIHWAADSLYCEWGYVLDLDTETFEIYQGFNTTPLNPGEPFYKLPIQKVSTETDVQQCHQIKLFKKIPFAKVNQEAMKAIVEEVGRLS